MRQKSHQFLILAVEEREVQTQLLDGLFRAIDRSSTGANELHNGILAFMEEGRILVVDGDHGSWSSLVDGSCNEKNRKQRGLVGPRGQSKLTRHLANEFTADRKKTRRRRCLRGERKKIRKYCPEEQLADESAQFRRPLVVPLQAEMRLRTEKTFPVGRRKQEPQRFVPVLHARCPRTVQCCPLRQGASCRHAGLRFVRAQWPRSSRVSTNNSFEEPRATILRLRIRARSLRPKRKVLESSSRKI